MTGATKPSLAIVFGHFSTVAQMSDWGSVEQFANPCGLFRTVHVLALGDDREYPGYEFGSVRVHRIRTLLPNAHLKRLNDALLMLLSDKKRDLVRVDELRKNIEAIGPDAYDKLSYYERWITSITNTLLERGVFTSDELSRKMAEVETHTREEA